jgi:hypothetical protein
MGLNPTTKQHGTRDVAEKMLDPTANFSNNILVVFSFLCRKLGHVPEDGFGCQRGRVRVSTRTGSGVNEDGVGCHRGRGRVSTRTGSGVNEDGDGVGCHRGRGQV